jgi:peptidyl-dipeptidase Dcp
MTLATSNPLLAPWATPYGLPPFDQVAPEHFRPAFDAALKAQREEIESIAQSPETPSFDNTVAAFDRSGRLLARLDGLFYNLTSSETSPALQAVEMELAPLLAAHSSAIYMHAGLFRRIDALHGQRETLSLTDEQRRFLERLHLDFVRAGARLAPAAQRRYAQVMERLAQLTTRFSQNVLADEAAFRLVLRTEEDFAGLPDFVRTAARQAAADRGIADAGVVTLSRSHIVPFLTFSDRRDLRATSRRGCTVMRPLPTMRWPTRWPAARRR